MICVLDASAAAAVLFREPGAARVGSLLFGMDEVLVPPLFAYELANVARTKVLRRELGWDDAEVLLDDSARWPCRVTAVGWSEAWIQSRKHGLTVYDGAYLALAVSRRAGLLTLDVELARAAGRRALL